MPVSPAKPSTSAAAASASTSVDDDELKWGRVLIAGGVDWPFIGRRSTKSGQAANEGAEDLASPHILRSLSNVAIVSVHGGPTASHFVCLDRAGGAWLFGRNEASNLGSSTGGSGGAKEGYVPETCPRYLTPTRLGHPDAQSRFTSAIIGRSFTLLVTNDGTLYAAGDNKHGQLGLSPKAKLGLAGFTRVESCKHLDVVGGAAGGNFTLLVCKDGKVYALGSAEHGQTGTGRTGEHIAKANTVAFDLLSEPTLVGGALAGRKVVQVACGTAHSIALDDEGLVYTWGFNGYCRLGLGDQKDRLAPVAVGQFAKANVALRAQTVSCGPANTTVVDRMGIYYIAGRWKTTGDGGGGSPYTTYKYLQEMGSCKVFKTASGGAGHFALAEDHADKSLTLAIAFGQGTLHSELGLGEGLPKASTKPIKIEPLDGLALIDVAAGQGTTLFLCRPSDAYAELPRHEQLETADECFVCQQADDQPGLVCDFCEKPFHLACLTPALDSQPEEPEWFCPDHETPQDLQSLEFVHEGELAAVSGGKKSAGRGKSTAAVPASTGKGKGKRAAVAEPAGGGKGAAAKKRR